MSDAGSSVTSLTLLGRLRRDSGDQEAWGTFVDRYGPRVYGWCRRWGVQEADACDLTQNVLLDLARQMGTFEYRPDGTFRGWLKTVAYRVWCDFLSDKRRIPTSAGDALNSLAAPEAASDFVKQLDEECERELLDAAMSHVRPRVHPHTWEAFVLTAIEERSGAEVAERLNMKVGAVWVARSKVKKMLQDEVRRLDEREASNLSAISLLAEVMNHIAVSACPPTERLNDLLDEQLLAAERDALEDHLATCPHCQQALLTASGDATQWDRLKPHLQSRTSDDHTPAEMLSSLKGTVPSVRRGLSKSGGSAPPVVPGYEILGELGRGGMAVVYRARQLALGREVALKVVLAGDHAAPELRARFRREAEAVARLRHPGVVQVYDVGEHNGLPYFSMELVEGGTLKDRLRAGSPDPRETAALVEAVARSVHTAHSAGVVHRDLKPANILLGPEPKIADFGLALDRDAGENGWTQTGDVLGTPAYMAPEQAQGRRADVGPCTDIHALGVILYEALTGRTPFAAEDNVRTLVQVSFEEPLPPRRLRPGVPRDLETVCLKCLEKNPSLRYASALDLADDLRRFLAGEPIRARQASVAERLVKLARRYPLVASLMAVIVLVTTAGFVGVTVAMLDARGARDEESRQRGKAEDAGNRALAALDRSEQSVYFGIIAQARSQWLLNNVTASARLLDRCPLERRGWEWHYLRSLNHCDLLTVPQSETPWVTGTAFSPDGKWVATSGGDPYAWPNSGVVQMLDATTGRVRWRKDALPHLVRNLAYSPDGRFLATAGGNWRDEEGGGKLRIWDAATGNVVRDFPGHDQETVYRVAFSPDGSRLATTSHQRATRVWDVSTGNEVYQTEKSELDSVAFTPDGRFLVFDGPNGITFREAATGTAVRVTPRVAGLFAISPEGARLATAHRDQLRVWHISVAPNGVSLSLVQAFNGHEGTITGPRFPARRTRGGDGWFGWHGPGVGIGARRRATGISGTSRASGSGRIPPGWPLRGIRRQATGGHPRVGRNTEARVRDSGVLQPRAARCGRPRVHLRRP